MTKHTIIAHNLSFDYNAKTQVFDKHSFSLEVNQNQPNKLYGIIGPSGTGKTTLISILGGQLKPTSGKIEIDGTDIYAVTDLVRRTLITMQMQTSTSLRGKLKYNMLFGLPDLWEESEDFTPTYTDEYLIEVLNNVGLWKLFEGKDGLDTLIGEGGLNLSGGQRQRLNFAGLYLRAKYFKPSLILIDEPTSSLDEISEFAITKMINELAQNAITLVVAHRLKTLDQAVAIFDSSLLESSNEMEFMTKPQLMQKSQYYQDLMAGKATLEE
jgi:ABC-type multidrug transport system fused ATPase/permease subunit